MGIAITYHGPVARWLPIVVALLLLGCPTEEPPPEQPPPGVTLGEELLCEDPVEGPDRWTLVGAERGIDVVMGIGPAPEGSAAGSGAAAVDLDLDGDLDLVFANVVGLPHVFLNDGAAHFEQVHSWDGQLPPGRVHAGFGVVDLNGDALPDIVGLGPGAVWIFDNLGEGRFGDLRVIFEENVTLPLISTMSAGDMDGDGDLDLLLPAVQEGTGVDPDGMPIGTPDYVLRNDGDDWTLTHALVPYDEPGYAISGTFTDQDNDGDLDLFVPYDRIGQLDASPHALYRNDGVDADGVLVVQSVAPELGMNVVNSAMGLDHADFNEDGLLDYCSTDTGPVSCLVSSPDGYIESGVALGLSPAALADSPSWSGWSIELVDLDGDGWMDAPVPAAPPLGHAPGWDQPQPDAFFAGQPGGTFVEVSDAIGFNDDAKHYGLVTADLDGDGWREMVVSGNDGRPELWLNRCGAGAWVAFALEAPAPNALGWGARLEIEAGGRSWVKEVWNVKGLAQGSPRVHVGLGEIESVDSLWVRWPDGATTEATDLPVRRLITVTHPDLL